MTSSGRYVYGLRVHGLDAVRELTPDEALSDQTTAVGAATAPVVYIRQLGHAKELQVVPLNERRCVRALANGRYLALDRRRGTAIFVGERLSNDALAHPYLGPVATTFNRWAGRETFHGGAFAVAGRAWAVLADHKGGKSSLLAALAVRGAPVVADGVVVVDGHVIYRGPRCIDLRQPLRGVSLDTRAVRGHARFRMMLPGISERMRLGGWVFPQWGKELTLTPVPSEELLKRLVVRRSWRQLPSDPQALLALATLPAWDLIRPKDWYALNSTCSALESILAQAVPASERPDLVSIGVSERAGAM